MNMRAMKAIWRKRRGQKGAVLVEFSLSVLLLLTVLLGTLEFGLEIYARNTTDRLTNRMTEVYASTRDIERTREILANPGDRIAQRCTEGPEIYVFEDLASVNPLIKANGTLVPDGNAPASARAFRLELVCDWPRLTPFMGAMMGTRDGYRSVKFARFRVEGS